MISIVYPSYSLNIGDSVIEVIIDGASFARLDVRSAVHQTGSGLETLTDAEPDKPELISDKLSGRERVFVWKGKSSLWDEKTYRLTVSPLRFRYGVSVKGQGRVDGVEYFSGDAGKSFHGSEYDFQYGFNPSNSMYPDEDYYFTASNSCHRWSTLMVPPMFCYSFRCAGIGRQLALGIAAAPGEHNFNSFDYAVRTYRWSSLFTLSTDQYGHTSVDGEWTAPEMIGYAAEDEFDAMRRYSDYYFAYGGMELPERKTKPAFWYGPVACGWIQQFSENGIVNKGSDAARETVYVDYLNRLREADLHPRLLIIDDKWQKEYGTDVADPEKWPDLRRFVDERRAEGIHTMLWFKIFDPEGIPEEAVITVGESERRTDVSHPAYLKILDDALYRIFSSDEGCYDCDGIKIDYAFQIPTGRGFSTYSGKYGAELLYDFMKHIYDRAKEIKPDAVINCSPCHPYFAAVCDQARLHDYNPADRYCREDMMMRRKLFSIAMPGALIDTDNAGFNTRRDTMRWLLDQPAAGIPDLYCISALEGNFSMDKGDLEALAAVWKEYTDKIDRICGN